MTIFSAMSRRHARGPDGAAGFFVVFALCAALSLIGWLPLSVLPRLLHSVLSPAAGGAFDVGLGCAESPSSASDMCSLEAGALAIFPAAAFSLVMLVLRRQLAQLLRALLGSRLPQNARYLLAPSIATLGFTLCWGYVHIATPFKIGLVPEVLFPPVIGLFTFATAQYGTRIAQFAPRLFDARDRLSAWVRLTAVIVISIALSFALMSRQPIAFIDLKQQLLVLVSLAIGYIALVPRQSALRLANPASRDDTGTSEVRGMK